MSFRRTGLTRNLQHTFMCNSTRKCSIMVIQSLSCIMEVMRSYYWRTCNKTRSLWFTFSFTKLISYTKHQTSLHSSKNARKSHSCFCVYVMYVCMSVSVFLCDKWKRRQDYQSSVLFRNSTSRCCGKPKSIWTTTYPCTFTMLKNKTIM